MKSILSIILICVSLTASAQWKTIMDTTIQNRHYSYIYKLPVSIDTVMNNPVLQMDILKMVIVDNDTLSKYNIGIQVNLTNANAQAIQTALNATIESRVKNRVRKDILKQEK